MSNATPLSDPVSNGTVVVVDDDPSIRRSVSRLLRSAGFNVTTFGSPARFLRHQSPAALACVLLDMCMEGMTGLEVQDVLQRNERRVLSGSVAPPVTVSFSTVKCLAKPVRPGRSVRADQVLKPS